MGPLLLAILVIVVLAVVWQGFRAGMRGGSDQAADRRPQPRSPTRTESSGAGVSDGNDAWEGSFWDVSTPYAVSCRLRFDYVDGKGQRTRRVVRVRQFGEWDGGVLMIGFCELRGATRTFRSDRIQGCVDLESGELVGDVAAHLKALHANSPERGLERLAEDEYDLLRILYFVGKADGQLRAPERAIIRETCKSLVNDSRVDDSMLDGLIAGIEAPSLQAFRVAVGRLAKRPKEVRVIVAKAAHAMVGTQKTVHPSEKDALEYLEQRLGHA